MRLLELIRRRLGLKLLLSYVVIILVVVVVLLGTATLEVPAAVERHTARMQAEMGNDPALAADLRDNFTGAIAEILAIAAAAAVVTAVAVSTFTAGRIVGPLQAVVKVSQRIASGDYQRRVPAAGQDELGQLMHSFNRMADNLERAEIRRMELIGNVAHELRTPLSSIRTITEGLIDGVLPDEPQTLMLIQREITRLQRLVLDLEELSRAEAGQIVIDAVPVPPGDLVRHAVERLQPQFADKSVALTIDAPAGLPQVRADPGRIMQVLLNLLGNALQYTPAGGEVTVRLQRDDSVAGQPCVRFVVHDTGIGIADRHLPHVFERFYRVDKSRSRASGGSGIGLTIAKHIVDAHGGRVWAESAGEGLGSVFTFTLPIAAQPGTA